MGKRHQYSWVLADPLEYPCSKACEQKWGKGDEKLEDTNEGQPLHFVSLCSGWSRCRQNEVPNKEKETPRLAPNFNN